METPNYFDEPTQVRFYDVSNSDYLGGIAIGDTIVCGCCGTELSIKEIIEDCKAAGFTGVVIEKLKWISISDSIIGE